MSAAQPGSAVPPVVEVDLGAGVRAGFSTRRRRGQPPAVRRAEPRLRGRRRPVGRGPQPGRPRAAGPARRWRTRRRCTAPGSWSCRSRPRPGPRRWARPTRWCPCRPRWRSRCSWPTASPSCWRTPRRASWPPCTPAAAGSWPAWSRRPSRRWSSRARRSRRLRAAIGPAIAGQSYEVPAALQDEVASVRPADAGDDVVGDPGAGPARRRRRGAGRPRGSSTSRTWRGTPGRTRRCSRSGARSARAGSPASSGLSRRANPR